MAKYKSILRFIAALLILGGLIRLFANQAVFGLFMMDRLWTDHGYFIYIYRVLGAFVIMVGLVTFAVSLNLEGSTNILSAMAYGFILAALTMGLAGTILELSPLFYLPDMVFCIILAIIFYMARKRRDQEK